MKREDQILHTFNPLSFLTEHRAYITFDNIDGHECSVTYFDGEAENDTDPLRGLPKGFYALRYHDKAPRCEILGSVEGFETAAEALEALRIGR